MSENLKAYMGFSRGAGSPEGACLVFAHNAKEARRLAHSIVSNWFGESWIDTAVLWQKNSPHLFEEADQDKLKRGEPHAIECPKTCSECDLWGSPMGKSGKCIDCEDEEEMFKEEAPCLRT